ncbi:MAG: hypothetical protein NVSMB24_25740 [Mucilaginibacter sp.]
MKKQLLALLSVGVLLWSSCSKTEIAPNVPSTISTNFHAKTLANFTASSPINLNGSHDITISGKSIDGGSVAPISLINCYNVHITANSLGNSSDVGIYLYNCYNITIDNNFIANVSGGVYVDHSTGGGIIITANQLLNMKGPSPRGQFVQFNTVSGGNNSITYNKCQNILGQSSSQEGINLYKSNGSASSPILVDNNWIEGGGPNSASGGIQLGDNGGSYEVASNNILVNPGQMGISISGGDHHSVINNTIYASSQSFTNVGLVVWGQAGYAVTNSTVSGNKVNFKSSTGAQNDYWLASGEYTPSGWSTNTWNAAIDATILPATIVTDPSTATSTTISTTSTTTSTTTTTATSSGVINLNGAHDMTISGKTITGGTVSCIKLTNCYNIYITQCSLSNSTANGIELSNCTNVTMEANNISNVASGIVASNCPSGSINVYSNQMRNMTGPYGSFVQFTGVNGGNNIGYNKFENIAGASNGEIAIHVIQSFGTSANPINIIGNWIRGGGPSASSGGINLGDQGGAYQIAQNNIMVDPGQHGMAIVGGDHISMINNSIYARAQSFTNVGLYVWGQGGHAITNSTVSGNQVNFANAQGVQNSVWLASGEYTPAGWNTNAWGANINSSILPATMLSF